MKHIRVVFILLILLMGVFVSSANAQDIVNAQVTYVVWFDNSDPCEVYDILSDFRNDSLWYAPSENTLLQAGGQNRAGEVWEHISAGLTYILTIERAEPCIKFLYDGDAGYINFDLLYHFDRTGSGTKLYISGNFHAPGLTRDFFTGYNVLAYNNLIALLGDTGRVEIGAINLN